MAKISPVFGSIRIAEQESAWKSVVPFFISFDIIFWAFKSIVTCTFSPLTESYFSNDSVGIIFPLISLDDLARPLLPLRRSSYWASSP